MKSALLLLLASATQVLAQDKLAFVFELVRHGARAPLISQPGCFSVPTGMLTQEGMRQRYILGRMNRERYIEEYQLLDQDFINSQIEIHSTDIYRAIQSAYSELLGFYPPAYSNQFLSEGEQRSLKQGKGMPPMKIRMAQDINDQLGKNAIIDGYVEIPVYLYTENSINDDINYGGCPYVSEIDTYLWATASTFAQVQPEVYQTLAPGISIGYDIPLDTLLNMTYPNFQAYCDSLIAERSEGDPSRYPFTAEQWDMVDVCNKAVLVDTFDQPSRQLMDTRMMRKPLAGMQARMESLIKGEDHADQLRYIIYSAHDTQVANLLEFFNFSDFNFAAVPYCSQMYFEVHYDQQCLETKKDSSCFTVQMTFNGETLKLDNCLDSNESKGIKSETCFFDDWAAHLDSISVHGDLDQLCYTPWSPPQ